MPKYEKVANIKGPRGFEGPSNVLQIGTVEAAAEGTPASATITGAFPNQKLNLVLPRGLGGTGSATTDAATAALLGTQGTASKGVLDVAVSAAVSPKNRMGDVGADIGAMLANRPALTADQPTLAFQTGVNPISGSVLVGGGWAAASSLVRFLGGVPAEGDATFGARFFNKLSNNYGVEFDFTGTEIAWLSRLYQPDSRVWIFVDGQPVTEIAISADPISSGVGSSVSVRLRFGSSRRRRITAYFQGSECRGFYKLAADTMTPATYAVAKKKMAVLGDSWSGGALGMNQLEAWPLMAGAIMGVELANCGLGGTGYVAGSLPYGAASRINPIVEWAPDYLVIYGSINDGPTGLSAAARALYDNLATASTGTKIIVVGVQQRGNVVTPLHVSNNEVLRAAAAASPNVKGFIDQIGQKVFTGTGLVGTLKGDGNADYLLGNDGVHPTRIGHRYIATWLASQLSVYLQATVNG